VLLQALTLRNFGVSHLVLGDSGVDLDTADALVRYRSELGLELVTAPDGGAPRNRSAVPSGGGGRSTGQPRPCVDESRIRYVGCKSVLAA
jgi:hypothetical protein